jgi:hypothetical protein
LLGKGHRGWARISAAKNVTPQRRERNSVQDSSDSTRHPEPLITDH